MRLKASMWVVSISAFVLFLFPAAALAFDGNLDFHGQAHPCIGFCSYGTPWTGYLTPSGGPSWTPVHAFTVGLVDSALGSDVYVTEINSGFVGGSAFSASNPDLIASGAGEYAIYSTGSTDGYCFFDYSAGVITVTDCSEPPLPPPPDTSTHIISTTPAGGSTVASSTAATIGTSVYIRAEDYQSGEYVQMKYAPMASFQLSVADPNLLYTTITFPINSAGETDVSTTTPFTFTGQYSLTETIYTHYTFFGLFNIGTDAVLATSTTFTVGMPNGYDNFVASTTQSLSDYIASSTVSLASCTSFTSFNLGDCMNLLFVPQSGPIISALNSFRLGFLSYAPWGYVTRFVTILSSASTSTIPVMSVTFPLGAPNTAGYFVDTFTLDPNDMLKGGDNALNSVVTTFGTTGLSFQDVMEPFLDALFAIMLVIAIFHDLLKMRGKSHHGGRTHLH